jgi:hypothetical protein
MYPMKRLILLFVPVVVLFAACKKKNNDDPGFQWPEGTGEYAPYTNGSTFTYEISSTAPPSVDSFTYRVTKDTLIDGLRYRKLESDRPLLASTFYCHYSNGVRTEITYNGNFNGVSIPTLKQTVLKANDAVNASWNEVLNLTVPGVPFAIPVTFTYTIIQKQFTKNVLGRDYSNSIHVRQVASIPNLPGIPPNIPRSVTLDNFYASGQGQIQRDAPNTTFRLKRSNVVR